MGLKSNRLTNFEKPDLKSFYMNKHEKRSDQSNLDGFLIIFNDLKFNYEQNRDIATLSLMKNDFYYR